MDASKKRVGSLVLQARTFDKRDVEAWNGRWEGATWSMDASTAPFARVWMGQNETRLQAEALGNHRGTNRSAELFLAVAKACQRENVEIVGKVDCCCHEEEGGAVLRLLGDVYLPSRCWENAHHWSATGAAATLFLHLRENNGSKKATVVEETGEEVLEPWDAEQKMADGNLHLEKVASDEGEMLDPFSLTACFKTLPSKFQLIDIRNDTFVMEPADKELARHQLGINCLPTSTLAGIIACLDAQDLAALGQTCKYFKSAVKEAVPYLKLALFPHQRIAVQWMLKRETGDPARLIQHPHWRELPLQEQNLYLDTVNGGMEVESCPRVPDFRGGLFCDEPGLGKTITGIALVLKTLGTMAVPPAGAQVTEVTTYEGRQGAYYTVKNTSRKRARSLLGSHGGANVNGMGSPIKRVHKSVVRYMKQQSQHFSKKEENGIASGDKGSESIRSDLGSVPDVWVGCDACSKWRRIPEAALQIKDNESWFCTMSPDAERNTCAAPQEPYDHVSFVKADGFLPRDFTDGGNELSIDQMAAVHDENVTFFKGVLIEYKDFFTKQHSDTSLAPILWWILKTKDLDLQLSQATGIVVSKDYRFPQDYGKFLRKLGLEKVPAKVQSDMAGQVRGNNGNGRKSSASLAGGSSPAKGQVNPHRWRQPPTLGSVKLDLQAVQKAIEIMRKDSRDAASGDHRFYLSAATLIIVPSTLIAHWEQQIARHTKTGILQVYVLGSIKDTPPVHELAWHYDVVITTMSRLSLEWMRRKESALAQIHWLRIIIDEGHMLGSSLSITNKLQMACALRADRRWIMTGTPTPNSVSSGVANLQPLLAFLHCEPYGSQMKVWNEAILRPLEQKSIAGLFRLRNLLSRIMIRATKSEIKTLPQLKTSVKKISFTKGHARSYNELVAVILRNLLLADWNDPDHIESLLSPKNSKWAREMLENVRMSCCIAGNCELEATEADIRETLILLADRNGYERVEDHVLIPPFLADDHALKKVENGLRHGGHCGKCEEWARLLLVTPCAHLLCLECIAGSKTNCTMPNCGKAYKMQSETDKRRLKDNPLPKWPVPVELIEWQTAFAQQGAGDISSVSGGQWRPNWRSTHSSKIAYLVERLEALGIQKRLGSVGCNMSQPVPPQGFLFRTPDPVHQPCKIIIFSQFWMHLQLIESRLSAHGYQYCFLSNSQPLLERYQNINRFEKDPHIAILLMDSVGSVGLDLSFVEHVFLMEPVADQSLEEQIVSRAHRMGAKKTVHVETLVMKGTVEEHILELKASKKAMKAEDKAHISKNEKDEEGRAQVCGMLTKLHTISLLRDYDLKGNQVDPSSPGAGDQEVEKIAEPIMPFVSSSPAVPWHIVAEDRQQRRAVRFADDSPAIR